MTKLEVCSFLMLQRKFGVERKNPNYAVWIHFEGGTLQICK